MKYDNSKLEQELIAILLYHPEETNKLVLEEECIYDPLNRFILKLFKKQYQEYKLIDLSGLISNYKTEFTPKYTENAVIDRITTCMSECIGASAKFEYYQETIFKNYINSEIMKLIEEFRELKITNEELLNGIHLLENKTIKLNQNLLTAEEIFRIINSKNKNINFRFKQLSETANIQEHDLVIVAARTGIGKSGFILNLIEDMSDKYNCILFNMEIAEKQIYQRLLAINTNIPMSYHDNPATTFQQEVLMEGCKKLSKKKIKIYSQGQNIESIRRRIIHESKEEHTIVFIDHVGLIASIKGKTLYESLTNIVKELRQISLDYDCTIFLVSQLNRSADTEDRDKKQKAPRLTELKDSGELEQSATTVILLHEENHFQNLDRQEVDMNLIIAKNRNGTLGSIKYKYNKSNQRFDDIKKR